MGEEGDHCIIETVDYEVTEQENDGHVVENMEVVEEIVETVEEGVQVVCHDDGSEQLLEAVYEVEEHSEAHQIEGGDEQHEGEVAIYESEQRRRRHSASSGTMRYTQFFRFGFVIIYHNNVNLVYAIEKLVI